MDNKPAPSPALGNKALIALFFVILILGLAISIYFPPLNQNASGAKTFEDCVKIKNAIILQTYPRQCSVGGKTFTEGSVAPIPTASQQETNIKVSTPKPNDEVSLPLVIKGEARVFEGQFNYRLRDKDGSVLVESGITVSAQESKEYKSFEVHESYPEPKGDTGTLEVFDYSAKDGSEIDKIAIPVKFKKGDSLTLKVFFNNNQKDPRLDFCEKVYPTERRVPKTKAVAQAALSELLKGPTITERRNGFITQVSPGVIVQKLTIENGTAKVDFNESLQGYGGGGCAAVAIRSQIEETLKQFPTVKKVVISVNDRTEDILQP
jgi:hypothetical protein